MREAVKRERGGRGEGRGGEERERVSVCVSEKKGAQACLGIVLPILAISSASAVQDDTWHGLSQAFPLARASERERERERERGREGGRAGGREGREGESERARETL